MSVNSLLLTGEGRAPVGSNSSEKGLALKAQHTIEAGLKHCVCLSSTIWNRISFSFSSSSHYKEICPYLNENNGKYDVNFSKDSKGLCLFIHGLHGHPMQWKKYLDHFFAIKDVYVIAPFVYKTGNCDLKSAAKPFLELMNDFSTKNPKNPIYIFGHSNGSRIAGELVSKSESDNPITFVSIAGVLKGTKSITLAEKFHILWIAQLNENLIDEISYNSEFSQRFCLTLETKLNDESNRIRAIFIGTNEDKTVFPLDSSLPLENKPNIFNKKVDGQSHDSIVNFVSRGLFNQLMSYEVV